TIALSGQAISRRLAGWISTLSTFVAFGGAAVAFFADWSRDPSDRSQVSTAYTWLTGGSFHVSVQILVDPLSLVMMLIVSGLGGALAKSAQLPLHTWLPDAMEGPTPVSALIHAATMVTAGVYLLVRAHPIFEAAVHVQHLAAVLGAITLLLAGLVALVQWDIK